MLFLASWCPFCRRFQPGFEAAAKSSGVPWELADVSDDNNVLWEVFGIEIVPTIIVFNNGRAAWRKDGIPGKGLSEKAIDEAIGQVKSLSG